MTASMKKSSILAILGLSGFVVMADNWVVSPILPSIAAGIGVDPVRAGLLITAYMIPFGIFQLVFGPLADRFGKRQVISVAMIAFTVGTGLSALGSSLTGLAVYRALTGVFAASVMPISLALIGDLFPMEERQGAIGTFMGVSFLGQGLSMAIGGTIAYLVSWRGVFASYAGLSVIATTLLLVVGSRIPSQRNPQSKILAPFAGLLTKRASVLTYVVVLLEGILILGSFSYLGAYIARNYHFDNLIIGLIMTAFGVMAVLGGRVSGLLAARLGRRSVLAARPAPCMRGGCRRVLCRRRASGSCRGDRFAGSGIHACAFDPADHRNGVRGQVTGDGDVPGGIRLHGRGRNRHGDRRPPDQQTGGFPLLYGAYALALGVLVVLALIVVRDVAPPNAGGLSSRTWNRRPGDGRLWNMERDAEGTDSLVSAVDSRSARAAENVSSSAAMACTVGMRMRTPPRCSSLFSAWWDAATALTSVMRRRLPFLLFRFCNRFWRANDSHDDQRRSMRVSFYGRRPV